MFRLGFTGLFKYIIKFLGNDLVQHVVLLLKLPCSQSNSIQPWVKFYVVFMDFEG